MILKIVKKLMILSLIISSTAKATLLDSLQDGSFYGGFEFQNRHLYHKGQHNLFVEYRHNSNYAIQLGTHLFCEKQANPYIEVAGAGSARHENNGRIGSAFYLDGHHINVIKFIPINRNIDFLTGIGVMRFKNAISTNSSGLFVPRAIVGLSVKCTQDIDIRANAVWENTEKLSNSRIQISDSIVPSFGISYMF